jgi:hypothetical protein
MPHRVIMPKSGKQNATQNEMLKGWQRINGSQLSWMNLFQLSNDGRRKECQFIGGRFVATSVKQMAASGFASSFRRRV